MRIKTRICLLLVGALVAAGCANNADNDNAEDPAGEPQPGGELTVLLDTAFGGSWPSGLDPATNTTGGGNLTQMMAIYGGLFRLVADEDGSNAEVVGHQAESWEYADGGRTLKIKIRDGITFSDGTDFTAEAVRFNIQRAMDADCTCKPTWVLAEEDPITTEGDDTVVIKFAEPNAVAAESFVVANVNWIASPTALEDMGEDQFRITPVGAGPFTVVSNELSSKLVLERNPDYFVPDRPYLDRLVVQSVGGDQPGYQALLAGQGHVYEGMTTVPLLEQAETNPELVVTQQPATSPYVIQLNTRIPPFDDKRTREAIYYATDVEAIAEGLFGGNYPASQTFTAEGGRFHHATIDGYRTYDLERATAVVEELGGLSVELGTLDTYVANQVNTALQTQWQEAGMEVTINSMQLDGLVQNFNSGEWQAMLQTAGAWDPALGVGVGFRFNSTAPFSGVADESIDELLQQAAQSTDDAERDALYLEVGQRISDEAYAPFILAFAPASVATNNVHGPGVDTLIPPVVVNTAILWDEVWMEPT